MHDLDCVDELKDYAPKPTPHFRPHRIILAKGSLATSGRRAFVEAICSLYPQINVEEQLTVTHNRIPLGDADPLDFHLNGKQTLVFGEHGSAVKFSKETDSTCPNFWHFSPYGFCPFDCKYCYLAGTPGIRFSPTVKIFVNLDEILSQIDKQARRIGEQTVFYLGKLQDGLALDPLSGYSRVIIPFFARHPFARLTLLTKATCIENLLDLDHEGNTYLSWSLNPERIRQEFEEGTPPVEERLKAMEQCVAAGYHVRAVIMPIIPVPGWEDIYDEFLRDLLRRVDLDRITLGCICIFPAARRMMESKLGEENSISQAVENAPAEDAPADVKDGRSRYSITDRIKIYEHLIDRIRELQPALRPALCLEEKAVFESLGITSQIGQCNCVL